MDFSERLAALAEKVRQQKSSIQTEEATKNAFVMPFISTILGYDVFNPLEVVPEFTADVGVKKGEKIDYAIKHGGEVQILIECKKSTEPVKIEHASQLYRYFAVTNARIAILTNGEIYQFFTDLDAPNRMDPKPFLVLDLNDIDDALIPELQKLSKDVFDLDSILNAAGELKYIGQIKRHLAAEFKEPDVEWVKFFTSRVYEGAFTQKIREQFTTLVAKATKQFLNDQINDRLKSALTVPSYTNSDDPGETVVEQGVVDALPREDGIETTDDEREAFQIVKAIVCSEIKAERVVGRDSKSYFAVLFDDNNRKPIARLHFNRTQKYLGLFDENKIETRVPIGSLEEIYEHTEPLRLSVRSYL